MKPEPLIRKPGQHEKIQRGKDQYVHFYRYLKEEKKGRSAREEEIYSEKFKKASHTCTPVYSRVRAVRRVYPKVTRL